MTNTRNLIMAGAAAAGLLMVSIPAVASAQTCYERRADNRATGTILGAVIGGGLGSSIAHGHSRGAGTVAGAVAGAAIGNSIGADSTRCYYGDRYYSGYDQGGYTYYAAPQPYYHEQVYVEPGYDYYYGRPHYYRPYYHHRHW